MFYIHTKLYQNSRLYCLRSYVLYLQLIKGFDLGMSIIIFMPIRNAYMKICLYGTKSDIPYCIHLAYMCNNKIDTAQTGGVSAKRLIH